MARCRGCGREIEWIKMKTGKSMPVDPERIMYWEDENGDEAQKKILRIAEIHDRAEKFIRRSAGINQ